MACRRCCISAPASERAILATINRSFSTAITRAAPIFTLANAPSVTGRIGDEDTFWGLEAAALWGPFSLQGEYAQLDVDLPTGQFVRGGPPSPQISWGS